LAKPLDTASNDLIKQQAALCWVVAAQVPTIGFWKKTVCLGSSDDVEQTSLGGPEAVGHEFRPKRSSLCRPSRARVKTCSAFPIRRFAIARSVVTRARRERDSARQRLQRNQSSYKKPQSRLQNSLRALRAGFVVLRWQFTAADLPGHSPARATPAAAHAIFVVLRVPGPNGRARWP